MSDKTQPNKRPYKGKQIGRKFKGQFPIKTHFIRLAFVGKPRKNQFITFPIHVSLL